jgi:hypothetical protein
VKTSNYNSKAKLAATSLVLVLVISATGILLVSGVMSWISTNTELTLRVNRFRTTSAAGGAATEKVVGQILSDFQVGGILNVSNKLASYSTIVPSDQDLLSGVGNVLDPILDPILGPILGGSPPPAEPDRTTEWADYEFSDPQGNTGKSQVAAVSPWTYGKLSSGFEGIGAYSATYRLASNVRDAGHKQQTLAGVQQDVVLASIPVFGFHVFYAPELEICPSTTMTLGRVHANKTIYCNPAGTLTFAGPVTTAQRILHNKHPADPTSRTPGQIISQGDREGGVNTLMPAMGTNRSLADFRKIIEIPPTTESRTSALGKQRLYNKADLIIKITSTGAVAHSGADNSFGTTIPWSVLGETWSGKGNGPKKKSSTAVFSTDAEFYNLREGKTVRCTELDVSQLIVKSNALYGYLGRPVKTLYIADTRTDTSLMQGGVRVVLGQTLPVSGLTIVTPNPLYVVGNYNVPTTLVGTTNTSKSAPAALIADAITILSGNWADASATLGLSSRAAADVTVNAALLGGIVPTRNGYYSGGLENFPRMLEDWTGRTLTLNGSFVALFESGKATAPWGASETIYKPPTRKWSFDPRLNTLAGLPPSTPELQTAFRRSWQNVVASR